MNKNFIILLRKYAILFRKLALEQLLATDDNTPVLPSFYDENFFQKNFEKFSEKPVAKAGFVFGKIINFLNDYLKDEMQQLKKSDENVSVLAISDNPICWELIEMLMNSSIELILFLDQLNQGRMDYQAHEILKKLYEKISNFSTTFQKITSQKETSLFAMTLGLTLLYGIWLEKIVIVNSKALLFGLTSPYKNVLPSELIFMFSYTVNTIDGITNLPAVLNPMKNAFLDAASALMNDSQYQYLQRCPERVLVPQIALKIIKEETLQFPEESYVLVRVWFSKKMKQLAPGYSFKLETSVPNDNSLKPYTIHLYVSGKELKCKIKKGNESRELNLTSDIEPALIEEIKKQAESKLPSLSLEQSKILQKIAAKKGFDINPDSKLMWLKPTNITNALLFAKEGHVGHVSMEVISKNHRCYLSQWPKETPDGPLHEIVGESHTLSQDIEKEGGMPDVAVRLFKVNIVRMIDEAWTEEKLNASYQLIILSDSNSQESVRLNCVTSVLQALKIGYQNYDDISWPLETMVHPNTFGEFLLKSLSFYDKKLCGGDLLANEFEKKAVQDYLTKLLEASHTPGSINFFNLSYPDNHGGFRGFESLLENRRSDLIKAQAHVELTMVKWACELDTADAELVNKRYIIVEKNLKAGLRPIQFYQGLNILHWAVKHGNLEWAKLLLQHVPDLARQSTQLGDNIFALVPVEKYDDFFRWLHQAFKPRVSKTTFQFYSELSSALLEPFAVTKKLDSFYDEFVLLWEKVKASAETFWVQMTGFSNYNEFVKESTQVGALQKKDQMQENTLISLEAKLQHEYQNQMGNLSWFREKPLERQLKLKKAALEESEANINKYAEKAFDTLEAALTQYAKDRVLWGSPLSKGNASFWVLVWKAFNELDLNFFYQFNSESKDSSWRRNILWREALETKLANLFKKILEKNAYYVSSNYFSDKCRHSFPLEMIQWTRSPKLLKLWLEHSKHNPHALYDVDAVGNSLLHILFAGQIHLSSLFSTFVSILSNEQWFHFLMMRNAYGQTPLHLLLIAKHRDDPQAVIEVINLLKSKLEPQQWNYLLLMSDSFGHTLWHQLFSQLLEPSFFSWNVLVWNSLKTKLQADAILKQNRYGETAAHVVLQHYYQHGLVAKLEKPNEAWKERLKILQEILTELYLFKPLWGIIDANGRTPFQLLKKLVLLPLFDSISYMSLPNQDLSSNQNVEVRSSKVNRKAISQHFHQCLSGFVMYYAQKESRPANVVVFDEKIWGSLQKLYDIFVEERWPSLAVSSKFNEYERVMRQLEIEEWRNLWVALHGYIKHVCHWPESLRKEIISFMDVLETMHQSVLEPKLIVDSENSYSFMAVKQTTSVVPSPQLVFTATENNNNNNNNNAQLPADMSALTDEKKGAKGPGLK